MLTPKADSLCSLRVLSIMTQLGHRPLSSGLLLLLWGGECLPCVRIDPVHSFASNALDRLISLALAIEWLISKPSLNTKASLSTDKVRGRHHTHVRLRTQKRAMAIETPPKKYRPTLFGWSSFGWSVMFAFAAKVACQSN